MRPISKISMVFNLVGLVAFTGVAGYLVRSVLVTDETPPCSTRYPDATEFSYRSESGEAMSPIEMQARLGLEEWGVLENASVETVKGGPSPVALAVRLAKGTGSQYQGNTPRGGVGFRWRPQSMGSPGAVCLGYSVFLPEDFSFAGSGMLPGLYGGSVYDPSAPQDKLEGFSARVMWRRDGEGEIVAEVPALSAGRGLSIGTASFVFPRGRWVGIEQELVLNTPKSDNGIVRLWVDGSLEIEKQNVAWRQDAGLGIDGLLVDVAYGGIGSATLTPKDTWLRLSPLSLRWK